MWRIKLISSLLHHRIERDAWIFAAKRFGRVGDGWAVETLGTFRLIFKGDLLLDSVSFVYCFGCLYPEEEVKI